MAKNKLTLQVDDVDQNTAPKQDKKQDKPSKNGKDGKKAGGKKFGQKIAKSFREVISELKKVDWPSFRRTKGNPGVLQNTSTVLVVVLFFLIIITAFDAGLLALLELLTKV